MARPSSDATTDRKRATASLPPARRAPCYAMTLSGHREVFETPEQLLRWAARTREVAAVCLDNCAWRDFRHFQAWISQGLRAYDAYERTPLYESDPRSGDLLARRRLRSAA